ncbi:MAG: hypothetical protein EAZ42_12340 [Verrucomicrobia bacterium]|nr:MAG: hypothetical protein EAZ42_12340 [Verrucomicrobiota bacterium]
MNRIRLCIIVVIYQFLLMGLAAAAQVQAVLDRAEMVAGDAAILTLTIEGGAAGNVDLPNVANLQFESRGQSRQVQIINGRMSQSMTYRYLVKSETAGKYVIPAFDVNVGNEVYRTNEMALNVLAAEDQPAAAANDENRFGFLTVDLATRDRDFAYHGEIAPVRIRAWIPAASRASLRSGVQPESPAFTLHHVSQEYEQSQQTRDGKPYIVLTWYGGISATKVGKHPVSLALKAIVAVPDDRAAAAPRRQRGGAFNDPFFDSVFDSMQTRYIEKEVTLRSEGKPLEVRPLPSEGRPENFSGAVGEFSFEAHELPDSWQTGDPQTVRATIGGKGNFSLMDAPVLTPSALWKSYPAKDHFAAKDPASFSGSKSFEFSAFPNQAGTPEVALTLSFFNPTSGKYQTIQSPAKPVQIIGAQIAEPTIAAATVADIPVPPLPVGDVLFPIKLAQQAWWTLPALGQRAAMIPILSLSALLILTGIFWRRLTRSPQAISKKQNRATQLAVKKALDESKKAAERADTPGFFDAGKRAVQIQLGAMWGMHPQAITLADVRQRFDESHPLTQFIQTADQMAYAGQMSNGQVFSHWQKMLDEGLNALRVKK